jgi:DNA-3-methyladenine glycosylase I
MTAASNPIPADPAPFRCFGAGDPLNERYHDEEWGFPVRGDQALFERISLEAFQSGLSWITILRKRPAFRAAFAGFDPEVIAGWGAGEIERLLGDAGIVRNRAKIEATLANARALRDLHERGGSLTELIWSHAPATPPPPRMALSEIPGHTPESKALAKALKQAGFRFVGPTTAYAAMQACGIVNDHLAACPVRDRITAGS